MHLVGFTIEVYYNARPNERQTKQSYNLNSNHSQLQGCCE